MSTASRPIRRSSSCRISFVHGSAPQIATLSDVSRGSSPASSNASAIVSRYDGVHMIASGSKSRMSCTCRAVCPPETGMTVAPSRSMPACAPCPPVKRP